MMTCFKFFSVKTTVALATFLTVLGAEISYRAEAAPAGRGKILLVVSVDWEGAHLESDNLAAMIRFREQFPQIPLLHFLNAAYFTKPGARAAGIKGAIQGVLRPADELGLHLHGWKSLFTSAGVEFRETPNFWGRSGLHGNCDYDCGHEVAISAYSTEELRQVIRYSVNLLNQNGFGRARSFRAGGWLASGSVLEALAAEGFTLDSSAVPVNLLYGQLKDLPLYDMIGRLWPGMTSTTQPWWIHTSSGSILELPDTGGLADYVNAQTMTDVFQMAVRKLSQDPNQDVYLQYGFHEETADYYLPQLQQGLRTIFAKARESGVPLESAKLPLAGAP